jgi:hypothetical protein
MKVRPKQAGRPHAGGAVAHIRFAPAAIAVVSAREMFGFSLYRRASLAIALSSEVDAGSREENASNKNLELRF